MRVEWCDNVCARWGNVINSKSSIFIGFLKLINKSAGKHGAYTCTYPSTYLRGILIVRRVPCLQRTFQPASGILLNLPNSHCITYFENAYRKLDRVSLSADTRISMYRRNPYKLKIYYSQSTKLEYC